MVAKKTVTDPVGQSELHAIGSKKATISVESFIDELVRCNSRKRLHQFTEKWINGFGQHEVLKVVKHFGIKYWKKQIVIESIEEQSVLRFLLTVLPVKSSFILTVLINLELPEDLFEVIKNPETPLLIRKIALQQYEKKSGDTDKLLTEILPQLEDSNLIQYIVDKNPNEELLLRLAKQRVFRREIDIKIARKLQDLDLYMRLLQDNSESNRTNLLFTIQSKDIFLTIISANIDLSLSTIAYFRLQKFGYDEEMAYDIAISTKFEPLLVGTINSITDKKLLAKLRLTLDSTFQKYVTSRLRDLKY